MGRRTRPHPDLDIDIDAAFEAEIPTALHDPGYQHDDLDEAALSGVLERTDDETADGWFSYPLPGMPSLTVSLAMAVGGNEVDVRVTGNIDPVLRAGDPDPA